MWSCGLETDLTTSGSGTISYKNQLIGDQKHHCKDIDLYFLIYSIYEVCNHNITHICILTDLYDSLRCKNQTKNMQNGILECLNYDWMKHTSNLLAKSLQVRLQKTHQKYYSAISECWRKDGKRENQSNTSWWRCTWWYVIYYGTFIQWVNSILYPAGQYHLNTRAASDSLTYYTNKASITMKLQSYIDKAHSKTYKLPKWIGIDILFCFVLCSENWNRSSCPHWSCLWRHGNNHRWVWERHSCRHGYQRMCNAVHFHGTWQRTLCLETVGYLIIIIQTSELEC